MIFLTICARAVAHSVCPLPSFQHVTSMTDLTAQPAPDDKGPRPSVVYKRSKNTKSSVIWADRLAGRVITVGGLFVILTVFAIMMFLVAVTMPLFGSGTVDEPRFYSLAQSDSPVISTSIDEYATLGLELTRSGHLTTFHAPSGKHLGTASFDFGGATPSAFARTLQGDDLAFGFADGTVRLGALAIKNIAWRRPYRWYSCIFRCSRRPDSKVCA